MKMSHASFEEVLGRVRRSRLSREQRRHHRRVAQGKQRHDSRISAMELQRRQNRVHNKVDEVPLSIIPNVELQVELVRPKQRRHRNSSREHRSAASLGTFRVIGPEIALGKLEAAGISADSLVGVCSPLSPLPGAANANSREHGSTSMVFLFPIIDSHEAITKGLNVASHPWALVLIFGGFAELGLKRQVTQVHGLSFSPGPGGGALRLRRSRMKSSVLHEIRTQYHINDMFVPTCTRYASAGFTGMGWVQPGKSFLEENGREFARCVEGAFLFETSSKIHKEGCVMYSIERSEPTEAGDYESITKSKLSVNGTVDIKRSFSWLEVGTPGTLREAMYDDIEYCISLDQMRLEAGKVAMLDNHESDGVDKVPPSYGGQQLLSLTRFVVLITSHVAAGTIGLHVVSRQSDDSVTMADSFFLFISTTSTVGHADVVATNDTERILSAVLFVVGLVLGLTLLGSQLTNVGKLIFFGFEKAFLGLLSLLAAPFCTMKWGWCFSSTARQRQRVAVPLKQKKSSAAHHFKATFMLLVVGVAVNLVGASKVYTALVPGMSFEDAMWHSWGTATATGFCDVSISSEGGRLFAGFHVISCGMWGLAFVGRVLDSRRRWRLEKERSKSLRWQLNPSFIDSLDPQKENRISKGEFISRMLVGLGAQTAAGDRIEWDKHIAPLAERFDIFDVNKRGYLTREDLRFVVRQVRASQGYRMSRRTGSRVASTFGEDTSMKKIYRVRHGSSDELPYNSATLSAGFHETAEEMPVINTPARKASTLL